ncbi:hypothetical protein RR48_15467 [Papilio machaon]|uniref:Uncharacterized protein n=1 Tax=Papilio machaon TaxID=76193 RepID=A0A194R0G0_PAPMA|nr:hypothetical protein RR48_15467 [Papilio machaon]
MPWSLKVGDLVRQDTLMHRYCREEYKHSWYTVVFVRSSRDYCRLTDRDMNKHTKSSAGFGGEIDDAAAPVAGRRGGSGQWRSGHTLRGSCTCTCTAHNPAPNSHLGISIY